MSDALTVFTDLIGQLSKLPVIAVLGMVMLATGLILKKLAMFPNKYIPLVIMTMGTVGGAFLGAPGKIDPDQPYPRVILGFYGFLLGFVVWGAHRWILKWFEKFLPAGFFQNGFHTDHFTKPKDPNAPPPSTPAEK